VRAGRLHGHLAVTFGAVAARLAIPETPALLAFGSLTLHGQTAAAVRLGLIGQRAAQTIISHLQPALLLAAAHAETLALADLGGYQPLLDLAGLRQPSLDTRLFAS
jgi:urease accessory protein